MKNALIIFTTIVLALLLAVSMAVAGTLKDYNPKNDDEKAIMELLKEQQRIINTYKFLDFFPLYAADAKTQNGSGGKIETIQEYKARVEKEGAGKFKKHNCEFVYHMPKDFKVQGETAKMTIGRAIACGRIMLATKIMTFTKKEGTWKIQEELFK